MSDQMRFDKNLTIHTFNPRTHVCITLDKILALYLFGSCDPKDIAEWVSESISTELDDFKLFVLDLMQRGISSSEDLTDGDDGNSNNNK